MAVMIAYEEQQKNCYLMHYRTKGSKNGTRRYQYEDGSLTPEGYIHYGIGKGRRGGAEQPTNSSNDSSGTDTPKQESQPKQKLIFSKNSRLVESIKNAKQKSKEENESRKQEYKKIHDMTDEELNAGINRLNKEKQYAGLLEEARQREMSPVRREVVRILSETGKKIANQSIDILTKKVMGKIEEKVNPKVKFGDLIDADFKKLSLDQIKDLGSASEQANKAMQYLNSRYNYDNRTNNQNPNQNQQQQQNQNQNQQQQQQQNRNQNQQQQQNQNQNQQQQNRNQNPNPDQNQQQQNRNQNPNPNPDQEHRETRRERRERLRQEREQQRQQQHDQPQPQPQPQNPDPQQQMQQQRQQLQQQLQQLQQLGQQLQQQSSPTNDPEQQRADEQAERQERDRNRAVNEHIDADREADRQRQETRAESERVDQAVREARQEQQNQNQRHRETRRERRERLRQERQQQQQQNGPDSGERRPYGISDQTAEAISNMMNQTSDPAVIARRLRIPVEAVNAFMFGNQNG